MGIRIELEEEVTSLLQKGAVEEIQPETPGFYSWIFLVPKKIGKLRLIIDLFTFNKYVFVQSFRMETEASEEWHLSKRLGIFIGLDGRLFACPDSSKVTQIPSFHSKRPSVSFQSAPIRSFDQPLHSHSPHDSHCNLSKEKSYNSSSLSRRLVVEKSISSNSVGTQTFHNSANHMFGTDLQSRIIRSDSHTNVHLYRNGISKSYENSQSSSSQSSNSIRNGQEILSENLCISPRIPFSFGTRAADFVMLGRLHLRPL